MHGQLKSPKRQPPRPGYDGRFEIGTRIVDDPYEPGAKITVPANVCADFVLRMHSRGELDEGQYLTAELIRRTLDRAGERGAQAVDPTREPVDGSPIRKDVASTALVALKKLAEWQRLLGFYGWRVVRGIVSDGLNGTLIAFASGRRRDHVIGVLKDGLQLIGEAEGIVSGRQHANKRALMMAYLEEIPDWGHEEREILIVHKKNS